MTTLVVGATGATGRRVVAQLLERGQDVRVLVRSPERLPEAIRQHARVTVVQGIMLELTDDDLMRLVQGCTSVVSCLGHALSLEGIFGQPRQLVTEATRRLCAALKATKSSHATRFVLMNSVGNSNRDLDEPVPLSQRFAIGVIRLLLPPHADNEGAADYLRTQVGQRDAAIEWVAVRPASLVEEEQVTAYEVRPSPVRNAIFDPGTTSRINVAHFMAELVTSQDAWNQWKGRMPVVYSQAGLS